MTTGEMLKACRTYMAYSQEELAFLLHIQQSDVSRIESGQKEPPISLFVDWGRETACEHAVIAHLYRLYGMDALQNALRRKGEVRS